MKEHEEKYYEASNGELNKSLVREIKLARNIQMKLLNGEQPEIENGSVSGVSIPARLIGGDYYDFYPLTNGKLRIVIGDVMGKGIPAAMLMILTRGAFRSAAESTQGPGETVTAMNNAMYDDLRKLGSFVTLFCADWDPEERKLTFANAGHNSPLIVNANKDIREFPKVKGVMLGGLPNQEYPEETITMTEGDIAFFYTDGIVEAQNCNGEMYRIERLMDVLADSSSCEVTEVEDIVVNSIEAFVNGVPQRDDITMVLLKIEADNTSIASYNSPIMNS
ncbi:PP2C family protein-serine/threonine phosphatase [Oceanobacillus damuensis]|uniref:PP2C family protein-serine/threonine phosphatase n=1 Tax=Oceanobacillus damuensis TaxID=937928 RepID=UPI00082A8D76|nr:PP2C family protein-serine/threonine phosphatase [Oceanobacillus damuensis]